MSLFQSTIIEKYIRELDNTQLEAAWQTYSHCFLNLSKQDNIRLSKEEQYQEGFLRDLFVDIFGYTLNPNPNYNLTTEFKNKTSSKKADGAILKDGHAIGVIELKGMNTTDLSKIEQQAFGYKNNQPKCRYVITSNFQKLRLYIDNAVEFIEFNLFTLTQDDFALLYLLLHRDSIMGDLPAKLKSASLSQEEAITKQLYKDYSVFKRELFNDLIINNPDIDALILFQKSQKLLDRLLFIFFAEDSHLLPANFAKGIINEWQQLKALKRNDPLYDQIKQYFTFLDKGYKDDHSEIFAYNGGLFRTDSLLDSVIISDEILRSHILTLSEYDFDSEVDVNILGHIFENSLSELDEVKAQLAGEVIDKSQTKRKKDGVFYTPRYITKYIVENTVGKLCTDKKIALALNEEDYQLDVTLNKSGKKRKKTDKRIAEEKEALDRLHAYRDWLLEITICDPAVGSGAFLNEALNFLIAEHEYIVEFETKLFGSGLAYPDIENSILENNLFGVDINEESVEIAKLSLWLRTAQPRRKLNNLNDNIQCGNSLIDDLAVAGDKAFNWQAAFPQVFAKGGFDVVIGNPPYVDIKALDSKITKYLFLNYETSNNRINLYSVFIEKSTELLKKQGYLSFIIPSSLLTQDSYKILREHILENTTIEKIVRLPNESFGGGSGEVKVDTIILAFRNSKYKANAEIVIYKGFDRITEIVGVLADVNFFIDANQWSEDPEKVFRINVTPVRDKPHYNSLILFTMLLPVPAEA
ncbi:N-6 DNA methylase, partial [Psychrobacter sp. SIMBA_152]